MEIILVVAIASSLVIITMIASCMYENVTNGNAYCYQPVTDNLGPPPVSSGIPQSSH